MRKSLPSTPIKQVRDQAQDSFGRTSIASTENAMQSQRVKVVVRVRPSLRDENGGAINIGEDQQSILLQSGRFATVNQHQFSFDQVLPPSSNQHEVFNCVRETVDDVMEGYNGTIMAYGQTGAGKTHTLSSISEHNIGVIPRAVAEIFQRSASDFSSTYTIHMSYVQLYMEMLQDLLNPESQNLQIREGDRGAGVFLTGAVEHPITCLEDALGLLELGERHRSQAFTHLNSHSSRSHAIAILTVVKAKNPKFLTNAEKAELRRLEKEGQGAPVQKVRVGRLFLVDLAGSERLKKSKSVGVRQSEAISINKSLTALGMCISARAEEKAHVPFRDSKLTRLLQESLGGNARTTLIVCVADALDHVDETLQSLQFGSRAMAVKTNAMINEVVDYKQHYGRILQQLDEVEDSQHLIEVSLMRAEEERDIMRAEKERDAARFQGILEELQRETLEEIASITALLEKKEREKAEAVTFAMASEARIVAEKGEEIESLSNALEARSKDVSLLQEELEASQREGRSLKQELEQALLELARKNRDLSESQARCSSLDSEVDLLRSQRESNLRDLSEAKETLQNQRLAWSKIEREVNETLEALTNNERNESTNMGPQPPTALPLTTLPLPPPALKVEDAVARMLSSDDHEPPDTSPDDITPHINPAFEFSGAEESEDDRNSNLVGFKSLRSTRPGSMAHLLNSEGLRDQEQSAEISTLTLDLHKQSQMVSQAMAELNNAAKDCQAQVTRMTCDKMEASRLISELNLTLSGLERDLARERSLTCDLREDAVKVRESRMELLSSRIDIGKRLRAALTVQKAWRRWKANALTSKAVDVNSKMASFIEDAKVEKWRTEKRAEEKSQLQRARVGRAIVVSSLDLVREAVEGITIAFVGRKKELETRARLNERVNSAAPILRGRSSSSLSTALSLLTQASLQGPAAAGESLSPSSAATGR